MNALKSTRTWSIIVLSGAALCLIAAAVAIIGTRAGWWGFLDAVAILRRTVQAAAVLLVVSAGVLVWATVARSGGSQALSAAAIVLLAIPVVGVLLNRAAPPPGPFINDVTTDLDDPPAFVAVVPLRPEGSNPIEYGGAEVAARQRQVHPEVGPILTALPPQEAFLVALTVAQDMGWEIVAQDSARGIIEAVDTTTFFRFKDDIVVRIRAADAGSRVDLRSRSRVGLSDLGKNAARIQEYSQRFSRGT